MKLVSIKRVLFYVIAFLIVMNVFFWSGILWEQTDEMFVSELSYNTSKASKVRSSIAVVDVDILQNNPSESEGCISCQRKILVNVLKTINAENYKPEAVILDFSFSNDSTQIKALKKEISALQSAEVNVYASYDIDDYEAAPEDLQDFFFFDIQQAQEIYDLLQTRLHTYYTVKFKEDQFLIEHDPVKYLKRRNIDNSIDSVAIESLVKRVHLDQTDPDAKVPYGRGYLVPLGDSEAMYGVTYRFNPGQDENTLGEFKPHPSNSEKTLNFKKKDFIIIGDLLHDRIRSEDKSDVYFPGPHLVAWTLSEELASDDQKIIKQYEGSMLINSIQTIVFSLFTVIIFALLFKYVKRLQTKPWALAILAILITFGFLTLYVILFLSQNKIPLLGLTIIGIFLAALLSWRFAYKFLVTGIAEGSQKYDVFISYSHGNSDWVKKNVFEPLKDFEVNGKKLNIFFDVKSIGIGEAFTAKYMWGIVDSKVFIPIISEEYYGKNHCKNEMDLAVKRSVEKLIRIMPIVFSFDCVPEAFQHINFMDITANPNFIEAIKAELLKEIAPVK
jgi:hypothetical protein